MNKDKIKVNNHTYSVALNEQTQIFTRKLREACINKVIATLMALTKLAPKYLTQLTTSLSVP